MISTHRSSPFDDVTVVGAGKALSVYLSSSSALVNSIGR